jgi:hypothetical protein
MTEAVVSLFKLYASGPAANLPNGALEIGDFNQLRGLSPGEMVESFFPSLPEDAKKALVDAVS